MGKVTRWGLSLGAVLNWLLAVGSVALAFLGAGRAGEVMRTPASFAAGILLLVLFAVAGATALFRRRWDMSLLHLGCVFILFGGMWGSEARLRGQGAPKTAYVPMVDGDISDTLWDASLTNRVGTLPFKLHLRRFDIEYYPVPAGTPPEMAPVRTYRSAVRVLRAGRPAEETDILVNQPLRAEGWSIYQASWGQGYAGPELVTYTVLMAVQDPGLGCVNFGFLAVWLGVLFYAIRAVRRSREVKP